MTSAVLVLVLALLVIEGEADYDGVGDCDGTNCDDLSQDQFIDYLTNPLRYDKYVRPNTSTPFGVIVNVDINHLEASQSQFTAYMTVKCTYLDSNLKFEDISPKRSLILGDETLKAKIWTPNILLKDQEETTIVQVEKKEDLVSIDKTGLVIYTYKMVSKFYCWMDLKKFPFDTQKCTLIFSDWSYNSTNLLLEWNKKSESLNVSDNLHFTEFIVDEIKCDTGTNDGPYQNRDMSDQVGSFSELVIKFRFHRDIGYYLLDFFIPSYLLVCTAWVTFWLQADAGPPRATLGATTVVAFITLHLGMSKDIPKVSYIKASDIWFLGVSCFIFFSLAEFAFVNVIWRRKKIIELKKPKQKYIIKAAVMPSVARKHLRKHESSLSVATLTQSNSSLDVATPCENGCYKNGIDSLDSSHSVIPMPEDEQVFTWTKMTPQEVAIWIDRKARIVFPLIFLIFNILYWVFVYYG
ncbi:cys-loop ligand-gated ion channel subunit precursor [Tribolium castaneum]|uniref:pH-sensitive chloride channel 2 n=1 Tax=Tribolium castaneum TaxID=7070 RepID=A8DMV4_TRICA|nr:cys-loop ligand-gated ion channel subunit precursor [Tribolium castaneum]ABU63609.1 cys-loop ligand-gated ion channel subunit [Tribolium castaneum]EFA09232.1 cys-loop ligand-gated ion channel subunit [Tribolium castaneum]|eukprot:NP_001103248.1 cys-loop ligand-gated ion channel subunit precursor [Tribolium castaneum]